MAESVSGLGKGAGDVGGCVGVENGRHRGDDMEMGGQVVSDETIASNESNGPGTKVNGIVPVVKMHKKTPGGWVWIWLWTGVIYIAAMVNHIRRNMGMVGARPILVTDGVVITQERKELSQEDGGIEDTKPKSPGRTEGWRECNGKIDEAAEENPSRPFSNVITAASDKQEATGEGNVLGMEESVGKTPFPLLEELRSIGGMPRSWEEQLKLSLRMDEEGRPPSRPHGGSKVYDPHPTPPHGS
jgi:hypothetical protein